MLLLDLDAALKKPDFRRVSYHHHPKNDGVAFLREKAAFARLLQALPGGHLHPGPPAGGTRAGR